MSPSKKLRTAVKKNVIECALVTHLMNSSELWSACELPTTSPPQEIRTNMYLTDCEGRNGRRGAAVATGDSFYIEKPPLTCSHAGTSSVYIGFYQINLKSVS